MTSRRRAAVARLLAATMLLSSCAGRTVTTAAERRGEALGLDANERDAFTREVQACMGTEPVGPRAVAPSTTVAVGAAAEAPVSSAGGLAAVSVAATAVVIGITYGAYRWWKRDGAAEEAARVDAPLPRDQSGDQESSAASLEPPADDEGRDERRPRAPRSDASNDVTASARSTGSPATPTLASCLDVVAARWRARDAARAPSF